MIYSTDKDPYFADQGKFRILFHMPGYVMDGHQDHGYGALATVAESYMDPDTWVKLHAHTNEEIISWVPDGVMRHKDPVSGELVTDKDHLMIMNAGSGFWHEEKTLASDPPLRMLQIFVRPHSLNLPPKIQHGALKGWEDKQWRQVFGQEGSGSDFEVRNDIEMYDLHIKTGESVEFPQKSGYHTFFFVFNGSIKIKDQVFEERKNGLIIDEEHASLTSLEASLVVAFLINPNAIITKAGTIGQ